MWPIHHLPSFQQEIRSKKRKDTRARPNMEIVSILTFLSVVALGPYSAAAVNYFTGLDSFVAMKALGITDGAGVLQKNTLFSFSNNECVHDLHDIGFPFIFMDLPGATHELANILVETPPNELMSFFNVSDCKSFYSFTAGDSIHDKGNKIVPSDQASLEDAFWHDQRVPNLRIRNDLQRVVDVFWELRDGSLTEFRVVRLNSGQEERFRSFLGDIFIFRDAYDDMRLLARTVITDGNKPLILSQTLMGKGDTETLQLNENQADVWRGRQNTNVARLRQNELQPSTVKKYTGGGFKKMLMPSHLHTRLLEYLARHEDQRKDEPWHKDDLHVNFYEKMTTIVYTDRDMRDIVFKTLKPILESWVGGEKLMPTSTYGIRRYYNGSILRDHVDIGRTHIVSAILNVRQDVDEVWPLSILDHQGRRHFIVMAPGEMCLYESATALHGRTQALRGRYFDNLFAHFAPAAPFTVNASNKSDK